MAPGNEGHWQNGEHVAGGNDDINGNTTDAAWNNSNNSKSSSTINNDYSNNNYYHDPPAHHHFSHYHHYGGGVGQWLASSSIPSAVVGLADSPGRVRQAGLVYEDNRHGLPGGDAAGPTAVGSGMIYAGGGGVAMGGGGGGDMVHGSGCSSRAGGGAEMTHYQREILLQAQKKHQQQHAWETNPAVALREVEDR